FAHGGRAAGIAMDRLAPGALRPEINPHAFLRIKIAGHALGAGLFEPDAAIHFRNAAIEPAENIITGRAAQLDLAAAPISIQRLLGHGVRFGCEGLPDRAEIAGATALASLGKRRV